MNTEDEAKTKWCPFARVPVVDAHGNVPTGAAIVNRHSSGVRAVGSHCIGSACMAWRWDAKQLVWQYRPTDKPARPECRQGFCGLAGKL